MRGRTARFALLSLFLLSASARAGVYWQKAVGPEGADVYDLAGGGGALWAGTLRGVWKLSGPDQAPVWSFDGLPDRTVTGVAYQDGSVWAATGDALFRKVDGGVYVVETLPGGGTPSLLYATGTDLWAAGPGVWRRLGGAWTALPSPGGTVTAMTAVSGDLVVGLSTGGAALFSGGGWHAMAFGIPPGEPVNAALQDGATLLAGTPHGVYAWNGVSWSKDATFGDHDVRALTAAMGNVRAATWGDGIFRRDGAAWTAENDALTTLKVRRLETRGPSRLFASTAGGPVYQLVSGSWEVAGTGLQAAVISALRFAWHPEVNPGHFSPRLYVGSRRAGLLVLDLLSATAETIVGDITAMSIFPAGSRNETGLIIGTSTGPSPGTGFPAGRGVSSLAAPLAAADDGSLYLYSAPGWKPYDEQLPLVGGSRGTVTAMAFMDHLFVASGDRLFEQDGSSPFQDATSELPPGGVSMLSTLGYAESAPCCAYRPLGYAGSASGGLYRRVAGAFVRDSFGLGDAALAIDGAFLWPLAAAGKNGVFRKSEGGWRRETAGLPLGADVRTVVENGVFGDSSHYVGTAGHGLFKDQTSDGFSMTVPIVKTPAPGGEHYSTELVLYGSGSLKATFTPSSWGAGSETVTVGLSPGYQYSQTRIPDAVEFLRAYFSIPAASGDAITLGTLQVQGVSATTARVFTQGAGGGTFGAFVQGISNVDAAEEEASVYGLRQAAGAARSNLAVIHLPNRSTLPIGLSIQVYSADGSPAGSPILKTLFPGAWQQLNGILGLAGLPDGSAGYARITRVEGDGPWFAYGVVNDDRTNDGSVLNMFRPGGLSSVRRLIVPVVLDVRGKAGSHYTTELTLANTAALGTRVNLTYRPSTGFGSAQGGPVTLNLAAGEQLTIPDALQYLRDHGMSIPDAAVAGAQAGSLRLDFIDVMDVVEGQTVALARTTTPNPDRSVGGSFGVAYEAAAWGGGTSRIAIVPGLVKNGAARSNLAVVHVGGGSEGPLTLGVRLFPAVGPYQAGSTLLVTLQPGEWFQWSGIAEAAGVTDPSLDFSAEISILSGDDTFFAYGVVNDNVTNDGSFVKMVRQD